MKLIKWIITMLYMMLTFIIVLFVQWGVTKVVVSPVKNSGMETVEIWDKKNDSILYTDLIEYTFITIGENFKVKNDEIVKQVYIKKGVFQFLNTPLHYVVNWPVHIFKSIFTPIFAPMYELGQLNKYRLSDEFYYQLEGISQSTSEEEASRLFNELVTTYGIWVKESEDISGNADKKIALLNLSEILETGDLSEGSSKGPISEKRLQQTAKYIKRYRGDAYEKVEAKFFKEQDGHRAIKNSAPYAFIHIFTSLILAIYWTKQNPIHIKRTESGNEITGVTGVLGPKAKKRKKNKKDRG